MQTDRILLNFMFLLKTMDDVKLCNVMVIFCYIWPTLLWPFMSLCHVMLNNGLCYNIYVFMNVCGILLQ